MPNAAPTRRTAIGALGAAASGAGALAQDQRPNTLVVLVDDLRWDALSVMGHPFIKTPNIDRIAREGVRFDHAYVTTPLCSPSRASFLTGQWVHKHEVNSNGDNGALSMKLRTFPQLQQKAGYETAFIGKWHMGNEDAPRPGFDRWVSFKGQGVYNNPVFNIDGKPTPQSGYITDLLSASAVDFLKKRRGKPFSLFLAHKAVHGPFTPAERHKTLYANETIRRAASSSDTLESKPALRRTLPGDRPQQQQRGPSDETIRAQLQCLASIDDGVGRILAALEETRQLDNTMIVFTSDNGYFWGEHGLGDKRAAYDESIRIPMLIRYPRLVRPGTRLRNFVLNTDLAPTMVEVSRATPVPEMKGRSLVPLLAGRARGWRTSFFCEYFEEAQFPRIPSWQAIRTERWKYIRYTNLQGMDELYDLASDAGEMRNLAGDASANGALEDCKEEMARLWRESF
jgi:N-acetylglucosamine-6-sulfatase